MTTAGDSDSCEFIGSRDTGLELHPADDEVQMDLPTDEAEHKLELDTLDNHESGSRQYFMTAFGQMLDSKFYEQNGERNELCTLSEDTFSIPMLNAYMGGTKGVNIKQASWQFELCPTTKKVHMHMVFKLTAPRKYTYLRTAFNSVYPELTRMNFKIPYAKLGSPNKPYEDAAAYCTKEETRIVGPFSFGKPVKQGKRTDLDDVCNAIHDMAEAGEPAYKIQKRLATDYPKSIVLHPNGLDKLIGLKTTKEGYDTLEEIIMHVGEPGAGKSHIAKNSYSSSFSLMYPKNDNLYFCGYNCDECLFFDEFTGGMKYGRWKDLCQPGCANFSGTPSMPRYNLAQSKAGALPFASRVIVFASNKLPNQWWDLTKLGEPKKTLTRRFTKIVWFGGDFKEGTAWQKEFVTKAEMAEFWDFCDGQLGLCHTTVYKNAAERWMPGSAIPEAQNNPFF